MSARAHCQLNRRRRIVNADICDRYHLATCARAGDKRCQSALFFNGLLSCSLSRGGAQFFTPPPRTASIVGAHSRRQDPKTPVEQALMRRLGTA
jgi:hypothetical protein